MDYVNLCKAVMDIDAKIRFAGICDETGEIKYGGQREGVEDMLSSEETRKSNLQALARWGLRNSLSSKIGKENMPWQNMKKLKELPFH
jgi:hypothetical protein